MDVSMNHNKIQIKEESRKRCSKELWLKSMDTYKDMLFFNRVEE